MSFPTQPVFVHLGPWDATTRSHPAMKWMEEYTLSFNRRDQWDKPSSDWNSADFTIVKTDGSTYTGADEAWAQSKGMYAAFTQEFHDPYLLVCWENDKGWEMLGQAHMYANCAGAPGAGEKKVRDSTGREWDVKIPGAFHFCYDKNDKAAHGGIEMSKAEIISDSMPAVQILLQRGVMKL